MTAQQQSPIELLPAVRADYGDGRLRIRWSGTGGYVEMEGRRFDYVGFHFHARAEHAVGGRRHALELHVVHEHPGDGTKAVLGVLIDPADPVAGRVSDDPRDYLPSDPTHYYRYEGSLTTSDYTENVSWVVFRDRRLLPSQVVAELVRQALPARELQSRHRRFVLANFRAGG